MLHRVRGDGHISASPGVPRSAPGNEIAISGRDAISGLNAIADVCTRARGDGRNAASLGAPRRRV